MPPSLLLRILSNRTGAETETKPETVAPGRLAGRRVIDRDDGRAANHERVLGLVSLSN